MIHSNPAPNRNASREGQMPSLPFDSPMSSQMSSQSSFCSSSGSSSSGGRALALATVLGGLVAAGCGGLSGGSSGSGGSASAMNLSYVSNGFGQLLPHTVLQLDDNEMPTQTIVEIRTLDQLVANVRDDNPIRPLPLFPANATLPNGLPGNHFLAARFTQNIDIASVLDPTAGGQAGSGLTGAITVVALDPTTGQTTPIRGRAFVGGQTFAGIPTGAPPLLPLQTWVERDGNGAIVPTDVGMNSSFPGLGFPGTEGDFAGAEDLADPNTIVFVVDSDNNLATYETFPVNRQVRMRISTSVIAANGNELREAGLASTVVGSDTITPEVIVSPPPTSSAQISPGNGDTNVDPMTNIRIGFNEPVQMLTIGSLPDGQPPTLSAGVLVEFGPDTAVTQIPFAVRPISVFDLTTVELVPAFNFPGEGPSDTECGLFSRVTVRINASQIADLAGNMNSTPASSTFTTGAGPGLVNAPVSPDAVYAVRTGAVPSLSVIDLNGFGASTGNPVYSAESDVVIEGESNYPNNPNVRLQGAMMRPALMTGSCTFNGGSAGVFTLTKDSTLDDRLVKPPIVTTTGDMMLGYALDGAMNNGPSPFGCQSGGGNFCAANGAKFIQMVLGGPNTVAPPINNNPIINTSNNGENLISWAPHPNPPPLIFPPPCVTPFLNGQEPTSIDSNVLSPGANAGLTNNLVPGDPQGTPSMGVPPSGVLTQEQNSWFRGTGLPQLVPAACQTYMIRQQVGHFLYLVDRARNEIVVLNSNRMQVLDRIPVPDPVTLAISPNLGVLAVTNQSADLVAFLDIDPDSATFHTIIAQTVVGSRPRGIAWQPGSEDIIVTNEGDNSLSIVSAFSFLVRDEVNSQLSEPFDVAISSRQSAFGFNRNVYFAYILNRNGNCAVFESGPNTVNGWGFDDIIGVATTSFLNPKGIQPDHIDLRSGVWIAHEGPIDPKTEEAGTLGEGAVSNLVIESGIPGVLPLNFQSLLIPQFRDLFFGVQVSIGEDQLSGVPVDLAFDNMRNFGGLPNQITPFSSGVPAPINGKGLVRNIQGPGWVNNNEPNYMFLAIPNPANSNGVVDVVDIGGGFSVVDTNAFQPGNQSIPAPNVMMLMDYWRQ